MWDTRRMRLCVTGVDPNTNGGKERGVEDNIMAGRRRHAFVLLGGLRRNSRFVGLSLCLSPWIRRCPAFFACSGSERESLLVHHAITYRFVHSSPTPGVVSPVQPHLLRFVCVQERKARKAKRWWKGRFPKQERKQAQQERRNISQQNHSLLVQIALWLQWPPTP